MLLVVDTETFGLDPITDPILEVGFAVVRDDLSEIYERFSTLIWNAAREDRYRCNLEKDLFVQKMHTQSGLWAAVTEGHGVDPDVAYERMMDWLCDVGVSRETPMVGSSVQFDRQMLAQQFYPVTELFSYRNIDVSSIKELCRRWNPDVYSKLDFDPDAPNRKLHRVTPDIEDTIGELKFYRKNFMKIS